MALRWFEGFETHRENTLILRKYAAGSTFLNSLGTVVGWQGRGFAADSTNGSGSGINITTRPLVSSVENSWIMGWAWEMDDTSGLSGSQTTFPTVALHNSIGQQLQFEMVAYNENKVGGAYWRLQVRRGSTVLATSTKIFEASNWYYIEVKATIRTGTNGSFEMRWWTPFSTTPTVDNFQGATITGINTADQGTDGADRARMSSISAPLTSSADNVYIDDWYVCDNTGASANNYLGKQVIEALRPSATGSAQEWDLTGSAIDLEDAWNESAVTVTTGEDDKRVTSDVTNERSLAAFSDLTLLLKGAIRGLLLTTHHKMDTSGQRNFVPLLRKTTGTPAEVEGTQVLVTGTAVTGSSEMFAQDPNTSAAWTQTNLNAAEFGVKTKA